ncbi:UDP binding domain-containing protein, partial [Microbacterium gubbeenense]
LDYADSLEAALDGSEAVVVVTEWKQFKALDPAETLAKVARPVIFDGRNILDPAAWRDAGWTYTGMGR